ncbi:MAG: hypothetical protein NC410_02425 [Oscillibacter sp.]|nr:hypothetical protein [Oscillibacter sp.]
MSVKPFNNMPTFLSNFQDIQTHMQPQAFDHIMEISRKMARLQSNIPNFGTLQKILGANLTWINQFQQPFASSFPLNAFNENNDIDTNYDFPNLDSEKSTESHTEVAYKYLDDSTSSRDINAANTTFEKMLNKRKSAFIWSILHTDFEDGMSNNVIEEVEHYLNENEYVTIVWLYTLFSQNQSNQDVLAALLRIVAMTIKIDKSEKLMTMVIAGLNQPNSKTQEAALAVIEEWRTKHCLEALRNLHYHSNWIEKYATIVEKELEKELNAD